MDMTTGPTVNLRINRFLPYWAVLQTDLRQTMRGWVFRLWIAMTVIAAGGMLLYRAGLHTEAGMVQSAAAQCADLFRILTIGSLALVVVLAVTGVGGERGTLADSVLSRGISRHQYFLAKSHSRVSMLVLTFAALATAILLASYFFFKSDSQSDLSFSGGVMAILSITAVLAVIVSWGITIGALTHGTVMGITVFWLILYGAGFALSWLPEPWPSPDREFTRLKFVLQGHYNVGMIGDLILGSIGLSALAGAVGLVGFSRRDV